MSQDDIVHHLMPKENVVWTYVIENLDETARNTFQTFSRCTSKEYLGHKWDKMHSGSLFYYGLTENTLEDVVN